MKIKKNHIFLLIILSFLCSPLKAQIKIGDSQLALVNKKFEASYNRNKPGAALAIIKNGEIIYKKMLGLANVEHNIPITDSTVFNIASNSKQFTSLCVLNLRNEGKLKLTDDIRQYLPELKDLPNKVTIKQLMNHTHGLPNVDELAHLKNTGRLTTPQVLEMLFEIREFNFLPGEKYQYNNTGYVLLIEIISRIEKQPFAKVLKEKVLDRIGMDESQVIGDYRTIIPNKAYSYSTNGSSISRSPVKLSTTGSSGLYASLNDMIKYGKAFQSEKAGLQNFLEEMKKPTMLNKGKQIDYGLGLQFENYKGLEIVFHGGGTEGYRSYMLHAPKHQLAIIYLSNAGDLAGYDITYSTLETLLAEEIEVDQSLRNFATLSTIEGVYELMPGQFFEVDFKNDSLFFANYGSEEKVFLKQIENNTYEFTLPYSKLIFHESGFDLHFVDFTYYAKKVDAPIQKLGESLRRDFIGYYENEAHDVVMEIRLKDGQLAVKDLELGWVKLLAYSNNSFYAPNSSFGKVDFVTNKKDEITGFKLSRQNINEMKFTK